MKVLKKISEEKNPIILNCGYGKGYSVLDIVKIFKKIVKNVEIIYLNRRPGDVAKIYSNTYKLKKYLNWKPKFNNIKYILISAINWEKKLLKIKKKKIKY